MLTTKTQILVEKLQQGNIVEAVKIAKDFRIGFTKEEKSVITRAHEMQWNPEFYEALGFNSQSELSKAEEILNHKYAEVLQ